MTEPKKFVAAHLGRQWVTCSIWHDSGTFSLSELPPKMTSEQMDRLAQLLREAQAEYWRNRNALKAPTPGATP